MFWKEAIGYHLMVEDEMIKASTSKMHAELIFLEGLTIGNGFQHQIILLRVPL